DRGVGVPERLQHAVDAFDECRVVIHGLLQELQHVLAIAQPGYGLPVKFAKPPATRDGAGRLLTLMERRVAPETANHVAADITDIGNRHRGVPARLADI